MKCSKIVFCILVVFLPVNLCLIGCAAEEEDNSPPLSAQPAPGDVADLFDPDKGFPAKLSNSFKVYGFANPVATQAFGADPTALVYKDRVYLYMSNDTFLYDPNGVPWYQNQVEGEFSYGKGIQGVRMLSSADMVNWTCHGAFNITGPENTNPLIDNDEWEAQRSIDISGISRSWAPTAAFKRIDGKDKFFIYWGNGGNGIGVVMSDSPTGPFRSPWNRMLIDRDTPNCRNVDYLFDPGVLVDDDGQGYLFFGGGTSYALADPPGNANDTGMARRVMLGDDMLSLKGDPERWHVPYLFEASEIAKIFGNYFLMWSTHGSTGGNEWGLKNTQMACMRSYGFVGIWDKDQWSEPFGVLDHPATQLGTSDSNNHGVMFEFKGKAYIAYHSQMLAMAMGVSRYRATSIDEMQIDSDGNIDPVKMTRKGVSPVAKLNPYVKNEAETIGVQGGIYTRPLSGADNGQVVTSIDTGDWLAVYNVDFGSGAKKFSARVQTPSTEGYKGAIELRVNPTAAGHTNDTQNLNETRTTAIEGGTVIGRAYFDGKSGYQQITVALSGAVTGVQDLVFVFYSSSTNSPLTIKPDNRHKDGFEFDSWQFYK